MTDIEWAAKWVGWDVYDEQDANALGLHYERTEPDGLRVLCSEADLAEAVRVKFMTVDPVGTGLRGDPLIRWNRVSGAWLHNGPAAFIAAVREVVGG